MQTVGTSAATITEFIADYWRVDPVLRAQIELHKCSLNMSPVIFILTTTLTAEACAHRALKQEVRGGTCTVTCDKTTRPGFTVSR